MAVWGSCSDYLMKGLEVIHLRVALYFYCSSILNIAHRAFYNIDLDNINSLVVKNASSYSLRKSLNVVVSRPRTKLGRRSFKHSCTIKQLENPLCFKRKIKIDQDLCQGHQLLKGMLCKV